ncbi:MAG: cytochrome-c oxidase, cbb3-type subunit III [Rhodospirillaceae bacterium]
MASEERRAAQAGPKGEPPTTGHEWDGIREFDNPMPRWWLWVFYASIVWSIGYWIVMPAWPLVTGHTKGVLGYSQRAVVEAQLARSRAAQSVYLDRIAGASLAEIRNDPDLLVFAVAGGRSAFAVNCSQCHGSGAQGAKGYPNLNDDSWLWGGTLEEIAHTIRHGIRSGDEDARDSAMPAFGRDELLDAPQIADVVEHVVSLSGRPAVRAAAERGGEIFREQCAVCHGETGKGNTKFGAPDLTASIWLYGSDRATLRETIHFSRRGVMPGWKDRLSPEAIKQLTIFVHSLGGGK